MISLNVGLEVPRDSALVSSLSPALRPILKLDVVYSQNESPRFGMQYSTDGILFIRKNSLHSILKIQLNISSARGYLRPLMKRTLFVQKPSAFHPHDS